MRNTLAIFSAVVALMMAGTASAYVGPGAGISVLGALWGLIIAVVMALGVILLFPIRMMMRKKKAAAEAQAAESGGEQKDA